MSGNSRSRPFPKMKASDSLSRIMGMVFFHSLPVPEFREWFFSIPFPFPNPQKSFPLTPVYCCCSFYFFVFCILGLSWAELLTDDLLMILGCVSSGFFAFPVVGDSSWTSIVFWARWGSWENWWFKLAGFTAVFKDPRHKQQGFYISKVLTAGGWKSF